MKKLYQLYHKTGTGINQYSHLRYFAWAMVVTSYGIVIPDHPLNWLEKATSEDILDRKLAEVIEGLEKKNIENYYRELKIIDDPMDIYNYYKTNGFIHNTGF